MNFVRPTDAQAFTRYCASVAQYWEVSTKLETEGLTYETTSLHGSMTRLNPLFLVQERLVRRLVDLEDRFGLNPAARQSIMLRLAQGQAQLPLSMPEQHPQAESDTPIGMLSTARH